MPGDAYEEAYMSGEGEVLYREKMVGRLPWDAALLAPGAFGTAITGVGLIAAGAPIAAIAGVTALTALPFAAIWLLFRTLRVTVSTAMVHIQFGMWGPEIPVEAIVDVQAIEYDWTDYGGFGVKYRNGTWIYNMIGDERQAVQITWMQGEKQRTTVVSSKDPAALAGAITEAMRRKEPTAPQVRVEAAADLYEAELDAEPPKERAKRAK